MILALGAPDGRVGGADRAVERDAWYVVRQSGGQQPGSTAIRLLKVLTADIAQDSRVIAHKFEVNDAP